jgi:hypothetical protein
MRRRQASGEYETDWQLIPNRYIKSWGTIEYSVEDIKPNWYKYSGAEISVVNNDGYFSDELNRASFFYGMLGIHKTMVKIEAGYIDTDDTEYPTTPTLFYGLIDITGTKYKQNNEIIFRINHISQIFENEQADRISGLSTTQTANTIMGRIRDHADGSAVAMFQKYISAAAWNITTSTYYYDMATTTSLQNVSCWELMQKLTEAENYTMYIDNTAQFYFKEFTGVPASVTFHFSGIGDKDRSWGHTIMRKVDIDPGYSSIYNRIRVKYEEDETTTSYYTYNESWNWGDSSSSFRFGVREYPYENTWLNATTAAAVAGSLFSEFSEPKKRITFDSKFVPQVMLMNRVTLTYKSQKYSGDDLWGHGIWNTAMWGKILAYNIYIDNEEFKVVNVMHDLDKFKSTLKVKEI